MTLISDMDINQPGAIPALLVAFDYMGGDALIKLIYEDICRFTGNQFPKPRIIQSFVLDVIWGWLVCMFGDYGVSPRVGWIDDINGCKEFLSACVEFYEKG